MTLFSADQQKQEIKAESAAEGLDSEEGFLWSRIDRRMPLGTVLSLSPFDQEKTNKLLKSLFQKKAISWVKKESDHQSSLLDRYKELLETDEKTEAIQIDVEFRAEVLHQLDEIESKNPFEILGLGLSASEHEIKSSYLELSRRFHPDRFFRKPLGVYKKRLDRLFTFIQTAYSKIKNPHDREALATQIKAQKRMQSASPATKQSQKKRAKLDPMMERLGKAEHHFKLGQELEKKKEFSLAGHQYELAAKLNPERENYAKAFESIRSLIRRDESEKLFQEASEHLENKRNNEAEDLCRRGLKSNPDSLQGKWILARCLADKNSAVALVEAKELLRRVKVGLSDDPRPCIWLAKTFIKLKESDKAKDELNEALRRDPENTPAKNLLKKL